MFYVWLAGGHLYGKQLFTWLSLVVSFMASFCAVLFPTRCIGWDLGLNWVSFWGISYLLFIIGMSHTHKINKYISVIIKDRYIIVISICTIFLWEMVSCLTFKFKRPSNTNKLCFQNVWRKCQKTIWSTWFISWYLLHYDTKSRNYLIKR